MSIKSNGVYLLETILTDFRLGQKGKTERKKERKTRAGRHRTVRGERQEGRNELYIKKKKKIYRYTLTLKKNISTNNNKNDNKLLHKRVGYV